jgi:L-lactate dehydrogenase complex protein LldG
VAVAVNARDEILARVRTALADGPRVTPAGPLTLRRRPPDLDLLEQRLRDYKAEVRRIRAGTISATVAEVCREHACARVGVPPGLPHDWRPSTLELVEDTGLEPAELDRLDGVLTGATLAIAETGTLVLSGATAEGRRALTLVPDLHICVVLTEQVVADVADAFEHLDSLVTSERRPLTFVSGPSATSDIELSRVEGVHGPRTLVVLMATPAAAPPPLEESFPLD